MSIRKYKRKRRLVKESACSPAMLNVKNQLMHKLGDDFIVKGASTVPKITIQSKDYPDISFDVTEEQKALTIVPKHDGVPDTLHKKRGIAFMRAVNVIYDYIMSQLKPVTESMKESMSMDKYFVGVFDKRQLNKSEREYVDILTTNDYQEAWEFGLRYNMRGYYVEFASSEKVGYGNGDDYYEEDDMNVWDYAPHEMERDPAFVESKKSSKKLMIRESEDDMDYGFGYDSNGDPIDESTVDELCREANEVLNESELATHGDYCDIDRDTFEYFATGTAWGAYLKYIITFDTDSDYIDFNDFINSNYDSLRPDFNSYSSADISFKISVDGEKVSTTVDDVSVLDGHGNYKDWDTNRFNKYIDVEALTDYVTDLAQSAIREIQVLVSNI